MTRTLPWAKAPGNVLLRPRQTGLRHASLANVYPPQSLQALALADSLVRLRLVYLVYYDTLEQCLALANVARMTAVGGLCRAADPAARAA